MNVQSNVNISEPQIPENYKPISMWGYFGYEILFSIPCVGFILLIVFSFGGTQNVNLRNFARSYFCFIIIAAILFLIFALVFTAFAGATAGASAGTGVFDSFGDSGNISNSEYYGY